jgi:hypothetical protein
MGRSARAIGCSGGQDGGGKCLVLQSSATGATMRRWKGLGLGKRTATLQFWERCSCYASGSSCRRGHATRPHATLFQFTVMLNCVQNTSTLVAALEDPCDTAAILLSFAANSSIMADVGQRGQRCSCTCRRVHERAVKRLHIRPGAGGGVEPLA